AHGWSVTSSDPAQARVVVHPNNPDGRLCSDLSDTAGLTVIDESFCDVMPERSLIERTERPGTIVLKSFGKFWGLAGLRLGFAIADPGTIAHLRELTGPWAVSGPALRIGTTALNDPAWADATRRRLTDDADRLDSLMLGGGAALAGGTSLFRLYHVEDAKTWHDRLARSRIWTRIFPYSNTYLRLGLPPSSGWDRMENAL
ncbi:MAG: aminotransferase class I/II-fold pyridoxal phosphate-dependent enzyme, partial [Pseudomonadota bacterium]